MEKADNRKFFSFPWTDRLPRISHAKGGAPISCANNFLLIQFQPKDIWRCIAPFEEAEVNPPYLPYEAGIHLSKANDEQMGSIYHILITNYTAIERCSESYEVRSRKPYWSQPLSVHWFLGPWTVGRQQHHPLWNAKDNLQFFQAHRNRRLRALRHWLRGHLGGIILKMDWRHMVNFGIIKFLWRRAFT
jgi:hypothetical protein